MSRWHPGMVWKPYLKSVKSFALVFFPAAQPFGTLPPVFALMRYFSIAQLFSLLLDCFVNRSRPDRQQDLEILLLRPQLGSQPRQQSTSPRLARWEKLGLAVLAAQFINLGRGGKPRLAERLRLFKPDPVLSWHRARVRRQWTFAQPQTGGQPATDPELLALLLRRAQENSTWG